MGTHVNKKPNLKKTVTMNAIRQASPDLPEYMVDALADKKGLSRLKLAADIALMDKAEKLLGLGKGRSR